MTATLPDYLHFIQTGQSLAVGSHGTPTLSTGDPYPGILLRPNNTPAFQNLTEPMAVTGVGETGGLSFVQAFYEHVGAKKYSILTNAAPSLSYAEIKKGTTPYSNSITNLGRAFTAASNLGKTLECWAVLVIHGERDMVLGATRLQYEDMMNEFQTDYDADVKAVTGQSVTVKLVLLQVTTWPVEHPAGPTTGLGQLDAARHNPNIVLAGPRYHVPYYTDGLHLTNEAYYDSGQYLAKAAFTELYDQVDWKPLAPNSIGVAGSTITAVFDVPVGSLAFDTTTIPAQTNYGFSYTDDGPGSPTITSVTLTDVDTVTVQLSGTPKANPRLRYGWLYGAYGNLQGGGGNLRDSDPFVGGRGSRVLRNWCCHFDEPIPYGIAALTPVDGAITETLGAFQQSILGTAVPVVPPITIVLGSQSGTFQANGFQGDAFQADSTVPQSLPAFTQTFRASSQRQVAIGVIGERTGVFQIEIFQTDAFQEGADLPQFLPGFRQSLRGGGRAHPPRTHVGELETAGEITEQGAGSVRELVGAGRIGRRN